MGAGASSAAGEKATGSVPADSRNIRVGLRTDSSDCSHDSTVARGEGKENVSESYDDFDDFDRMVQRINTVGPEPQYLQSVPPPTGPALENPARGFQPCATLQAAS